MLESIMTYFLFRVQVAASPQKRKPTPPRCAQQPLPREGARVDTPSFLWKEVARRGGGWRGKAVSPTHCLPSEGADRVALQYIPHCSITASMPLLPSALPPKGEARRYVTNDFLNLIALPMRRRLIWRRLRRKYMGRCPKSGIQVTSHQSPVTSP